MPRAIPAVDVVRLHLQRGPQYLPSSSASSSSSEEAGSLWKRSKIQSASNSSDGLIAVECWRYRVVPSDATSMVGDTILDAYRREASRQLADAIGIDPLCIVEPLAGQH